VERLERTGESFVAHSGTESIEARTVLLATGVVDVEPALPDVKDAIRSGLVRHCPICDGFEVIGKKVAVIGRGSKGVSEARFIQHYTTDLVLFTLGAGHEISDEDRVSLESGGIVVVDESLSEVCTELGAIVGVTTQSGKTYRFDSLYSALGCAVRSGLAREVGARCDEQGQIVVDDKLRTSIPNLYAVGDVANDLNQIAVAAGHAAIAATCIHNALRG
jgi:thioredoxin reductase (NADPH)